MQLRAAEHRAARGEGANGVLGRRRAEGEGLTDATKKSALPAYLALLAAVAGIAWSAILVRWAGVPGAASAFYRVLVAGAVLIPWRLVARRGATVSPPRAAAVAVLGGVFFALDIALWNTSVMYTGAAVASILGNNTPVFVGILSWLVLRKRPRGSFWIGLSLSLAGCLTIMRGAGAGRLRAPITLYGNLLAIGAQRVLRRLPGDDPARPAGRWTR